MMSVQIGYISSVSTGSNNQYASLYTANQITSNFESQNSNQLRPTFPLTKNISIPNNPTLNINIPQIGQMRQKSKIVRRTVDYHCSIVNWLHNRTFFKNTRQNRNLQPDASYNSLNCPPSMLLDIPVNTLCTRAVRMAMNKVKCPIFTTKWTPEGRRLVTGASSGEFTLWHGITFSFETILQAHDIAVRAMIWSHSDQWLVTADHGGFVKYWQSNMNNVKMYQAHKEAVRGLSFCPLDQKIASCSDDGTVRVWDFYRCYEEKIMRGHGADVRCVDWHPQKGLIASGSRDNQQPVKLWDPRTGNSLATVHAHKNTVMDIKWNKNGNWLLTASRDHLIKLFDIRNFKEEVQCFRGHKKEATTLSWHPIHETLFSSGGSDGAILFWLIGNDKELGGIEGAHGSESMVWSMDWHPLGHILASGSNDHTTKFWTRNRPGDQMRDKYNLNTLPPGVLDEIDIDFDASGQGNDNEFKNNDMDGGATTSIPGLDSFSDSNTMSSVAISIHNAMLAAAALKKKLVYTKPVPKEFEKAWFDGRVPIVSSRAPILPNPILPNPQYNQTDLNHLSDRNLWPGPTNLQLARPTNDLNNVSSHINQYSDQRMLPNSHLYENEQMQASNYNTADFGKRPFYDLDANKLNQDLTNFVQMRPAQGPPDGHHLYVDENPHNSSNQFSQQFHPTMPHNQSQPQKNDYNLPKGRLTNPIANESVRGPQNFNIPQKFLPRTHKPIQAQYVGQKPIEFFGQDPKASHNDNENIKNLQNHHRPSWSGPNNSNLEFRPPYNEQQRFNRPQFRDGPQYNETPYDEPIRPQFNERSEFNQQQQPQRSQSDEFIRPINTAQRKSDLPKPALLGHSPADSRLVIPNNAANQYGARQPFTDGFHSHDKSQHSEFRDKNENNSNMKYIERRNENMDEKRTIHNPPSLINMTTRPPHNLKRKIESIDDQSGRELNGPPIFGMDRGKGRGRGRGRTNKPMPS